MPRWPNVSPLPQRLCPAPPPFSATAKTLSPFSYCSWGGDRPCSALPLKAPRRDSGLGAREHGRVYSYQFFPAHSFFAFSHLTRQPDTSLTTRTSRAVTEGRVFRPLHTSRSSFHVRASLRLPPLACHRPPALEACAAVSGALPAGSCSSWALQASRSHPGAGWNFGPARSLLIDSWVY